MYFHCDHWEQGARTGKSGGLHSENQVMVGSRKKISTLDGPDGPKLRDTGPWCPAITARPLTCRLEAAFMHNEDPP